MAYKLAFVITLLITAGMGVLGFVVVTNQTEVMRSEANAFGRTVVAQLAETAKEPVLAEDELALQVMVNNLAHGGKLLGAVVYAENGSVLNQLGVVPRFGVLDVYNEARRIERDFYALDWRHELEEGGSEALISFITPIRFRGLTVGHALVTFSRTQMVESERKAKQMIIAATVALILLTIGGAIIMSRKISQPIYELMHASQEIGEGNLAYRINDRRNDELGTLMSAFNNMAQSLLEKSQVENALSRYMSDNIASEIISNINQVQLGGKHVQATVLFADIVGFTRLSEDMTPEEVANFLNEYFGYITRVSQLYRGTIDKFMGDCAMVVFGVPDEDPNHRFNAIACAVMIQRLTERLNLVRMTEGKPAVKFRIGINTGDMLAGNMGSHDRMQYTVVGDAVNLASRLSSVAEPGEIVIRDEHYNDPDVQRRVIARKFKQIKIRGKTKPVTIYRVRDVATTYRREMDEQLDELVAERLES
ncbi:MAG TPA: HAMP domain-containing protein [Thioalkalivibrio sp.]|nr:HAMP domain-containing protein [Thioalkalivibrio sp.]